MGVIYAPQQKNGFSPFNLIGQVANVASGGALTPLLAGAGMISGLVNGDYAGAGLSALAGASGGLFGKGVQNGLNNMFGTGAKAANAGVNTGVVNNAIHNTLTNNIPEMSRISDVALGTSNQIFDGGKTLGKYKLGGSWS